MRKGARYLQKAIVKDAFASGKMALVSGPRQVGKTTLAKALLNSEANYFSWDDPAFQRAWIKDPGKTVSQIETGPICFDELHKYRNWKNSLKGLYDRIGGRQPMIVTGSARLDIYRKGGDSMMGRYFPYRLHPMSVAESPTPPSPDQLEARKVEYPLEDLMKLSGFPEPLFAGSEAKTARWSRLRSERLYLEDVRDLRNISQLQQLKVMGHLLPTKVGAPLSLNSLREDLDVAYSTVRDWSELFSNLYVTFLISPHSTKLARALKLERKLYLFDPTSIESLGARLENMVALHLLKSCDFWTDTAQGYFELKYVRTKEKEEVDFCILRDRKVWMLVESKTSETEISPVLKKFHGILKPRYCFQTVLKKGYDRVDAITGIRVMDTEKFLSMLV